MDAPKLLQPYVPRLVLEWLVLHSDEKHREIEGSLVFVDISGFTKLSERLARRGKVGAEELTDAIATCFTRLLGVAYGNDGGLIKFGGDALLLFFTGAEHAQKAARAAVGMRRALREIGTFDYSGTRVTLRMSVGIMSGVFQFFFVGSEHRELLVTGRAASQTVEMEQTATAGEIVIAPSTAALLRPNVVGDAKGPGRLLKRDPGGLSSSTSNSWLETNDAIIECVPVAIRSRILSESNVPEHKRVTVAFVGFSGIDSLLEEQGPDEVALVLDQLVRTVQSAAAANGVTFLGSDIDRDGGKIILSAGAPDSAGDDEERMLLTLRNVFDSKLKLSIRAGVNRGAVFAGDIGPPYRRTYTVMGDAVNLAARLMGKAAPGQIIASPSVLNASHSRFSTTALEPFTVKGKSKPVQAHVVGEVSSGGRGVDFASMPFVGRQREMAVLAEALREVIEGRGRLIEIVGEPGVGKSRLASQARALLARDVRRGTMVCELYKSSTPYAAWNLPLRAAIGIDRNASDAEILETLSNVVRQLAPQQLPWLSLIARAFGVEAPPSPEVLQLDEKFVGERLRDAVASLLEVALDTPVMLLVEDAHWMDEASADLMHHLVREIGEHPWVVVTIRREGPGGFHAAQQERFTQLHLEPLTLQESSELIDQLTEQSPLTPHDSQALCARAGGNPMYLAELVAAAQQAGTIEGLPDSVESLVTARIDRLEPADRLLLRELSVLGSSFDWMLARSVIDGFPTPEDRIWERLAGLIAFDARGSVQFSNLLVRDTAYEGLPFRKRRELHALAGTTIESSGQAEDQAAILSLHFLSAGRFVEAWRYARTAADKARDIYANVDAAVLYERAIDSARKAGTVRSEELATTYETLGDVRVRIGEYSKAGAAYKAARSMLDGDAIGTARLLQKEGGVAQLSGRYSDALRWLRRAQDALGKDGTQEHRAQRARLAVAYASVRKDQGRPVDVIASSRNAIAQAEDCADKQTLAHAYLLLDTGLIAMGKPDEATYSHRALKLYEELGDLAGQAMLLNNLGTQAYWQGRWDESRMFYERGQAACEKAGDIVVASIVASNIAEILSDQGHFADAEPLFRYALRVARAAGRQSSTAYTLSNLGRLAYRQGHFDEGMSLLEQARQIFEESGSVSQVFETDARIAECMVMSRRPTDAIEVLRRIQERSRSYDAGVVAAISARVKGAALRQLGELEQASASLDEALAAARSRSEPLEEALSLREKAVISKLRGNEENDELQASRAILERLGVITEFQFGAI
ncbi:MAG: tetratricopeptide repeat protein [Actinomycetota bacterium]